MDEWPWNAGTNYFAVTDKADSFSISNLFNKISVILSGASFPSSNHLTISTWQPGEVKGTTIAIWQCL